MSSPTACAWRSAWLVVADEAELPLLPHFLRQVDWVPLALGETPMISGLQRVALFLEGVGRAVTLRTLM